MWVVLDGIIDIILKYQKHFIFFANHKINYNYGIFYSRR